MQVLFVWLVICSRSESSSSITIDDTLLGRFIELRIHVFDDAGRVFPSCSYFRRKADQPLYWLVGGKFALRSMLNIYHGLSYIHLGLGRYVTFHYILRILGAEYILFLGSINTRSM